MTSTDDKELTMILVGDVFVSREDPKSVFQHIGHILREADFTFGNLEGPISDHGTHKAKEASSAWKSNVKTIEAIEAGGFDAMCVTNNHILDCGMEAMFETLGHLDRIGVKHTGAGHNFAEAHAPAIVEKNGCRAALLGYTSVFLSGWEAKENSPGLAVMRAQTAYQPHRRVFEVPGAPPTIKTWMLQEDKDQLAKDIADARKKADIVVTTFHWGVSGGFIKLTDYQKELAHHAIDSGADAVFGHHTHCLQGVEMYKGKPIFYSLGNLTFANHNAEKNSHELETAVVRCRIRNKKIMAVEYYPTRSDGKLDPHVLNPQTNTDIVDLIASRSKDFGTKFNSGKEVVEVLATK